MTDIKIDPHEEELLLAAKDACVTLGDFLKICYMPMNKCPALVRLVRAVADYEKARDMVNENP